MTFFDKKQDVLKIELTPYGRSLLSSGKLMPKHYAFFDDDIVYDVATIGREETQSQTKNRIVNETPRMRPQRDLTSPEGLITRYERTSDSSRPFSELNLNYLTEPIGTSDGTERDSSSWHLTTILGEIDSVESTLQTGDSHLRQIPQVNMTVEYTMQIRNQRDDHPVRGQVISETIPSSRVFEDGTYLEVLDEQVIARIIEENGFTLKEGLELEAYMFSEDEQDLISMKITPRTKSIVNDMLIEPEDNFIEIDSSYLEYYLTVYYDDEIPDSDLCKGVSKLKKEDILLDVDVNCPDEQGVDFDIYRTRVANVEKC